MPKEVLEQYMSLEREMDRQRLMFVLQSAPLLKGVKMSCILILNHSVLNDLRRELHGTPLHIWNLFSDGKKDTVLIYRPLWMELYLRRPEIQMFLSRYGYDKEATAFPLNGVLEKLGERVAYFHKYDGTFPHEIGVFLGYPLEDVKGFIRYEGEHFLVNGYWKVYSDVSRAKRRFRMFDDVKMQAVQEVFAGKSIREITR